MNANILVHLRRAFYLLIILFALNQTEQVYIKSDFVQKAILGGTISLSLALLVVEILNRSSFRRILVPSLACIVLIWLNPLAMLAQSSSWKTQTLMLVDQKNDRHVVEHQIKDLGALGYSKREVEIFYLIKGKVFVYICPYDHRNFLGYRWKDVSEYINEAQLREI